MIGEINTKPQAGGIDIQGIINQYQAEAGENISAGDFVEFINRYFNNKTISVQEMYDLVHTSATVINPSKVFVTYNAYGSGKVYGIVCEVSKNTITTGTETFLLQGYNSTTSGNLISSTLIDENKIIIAYAYSSSETKAIICTISGTTISVGNSTNVNSYTNDIFITALENNKAFLVSGSGSSTRANIIEISGTTITVGTTANIVSSKGRQNVTTINNSTVIVTYADTSSYVLSGAICTINGTNITRATPATLISSSLSFPSTYRSVSSVLINPNKVFVTYNTSSSYHRLGAIVCTVNNTTITPSNGTSLVNTNNSSENVNSTLIANNKVAVVHRKNSYLGAIVCTINDTTITPATDTTLDSNNGSYDCNVALSTSTNTLFVVHCTSSSTLFMSTLLCSVIGTTINTTYSATTIKKIVTSTQEINGISQEDGSGGNTIDVIEPYTS